MNIKTRIIAGFISILFVSAFINITTLLIVLAITGVVFLLEKISFKLLIKRVILLIPFSVFFLIAVLFSTPGQQLYVWSFFEITQEGLIRTQVITLKLLISAFMFRLILGNSGFADVRKGFQQLGIPSIFITILDLTFRFLFLFYEEIKKMQKAQYARGYLKKYSIFSTKERIKYINLLGMAFIRSLDRSERIHKAMLSRNYNQNFIKSRFSLNNRELISISIVVLINLVVLLYDRGALL